MTRPSILPRRAALIAGAGAAASSLVPGLALAAPKIGAPAPAFTAVDSDGKSRSLAEFAGKTVVLEWTNHDCPYVVKHYGSGNMQALQKAATAQGVVWLTVVSSMPNSQGYVTAPQANELTRKRSAAPSAVLLDPDGIVGRAYDARVTPHMYLIDPKGTLVYMGGIDSIRSTNVDDIPRAVPYMKNALAELAAGKPIANAVTPAYGCTVKYKSS